MFTVSLLGRLYQSEAQKPFSSDYSPDSPVRRNKWPLEDDPVDCDDIESALSRLHYLSIYDRI